MMATGHSMMRINELLLNIEKISNYSEEHQGLLDYMIPSVDLKWSMLFTTMENAKRQNVFEDYSISQNSLEQVVLSFIKNQKGRLVDEK